MYRNEAAGIDFKKTKFSSVLLYTLQELLIELSSFTFIFYNYFAKVNAH